MINNSKYKISVLSKNLNMKNKDLLDILVKVGITGKTHSGTLETYEFSMLFDYLTRNNQMVDINSYIMGMTEINDPAIVGLCAQSETEGASGNAAKAEKEDNTAKAESTAKGEKPEVSSSKNADQGAKSKEDKKVDSSNKTAPASGVKGRGDERSDKEKEKAKAKPQPERKEKQKVAPVDRFAKGPTVTPSQKPTKKDNKPLQDKNKQNVKKTVTEIAIADDSVESKAYTGAKSRVIDTRASDIDLSKYDEKLETFVDPSSNEEKMGRQKVKRQQKGGVQQGQQGGQRGDKNQSKSFGKTPFTKDSNQKHKKKDKDSSKPQRAPVSVSIGEEITVGELAAMLKVTAAEVIKKLMMLGVMASVNQTIDFDTAEYVATELGATVSRAVEVKLEDKLFDTSEDDESDLVERAPVVCVMGHVDHGKTSILDRIRHTNVTAGEAGGITQAIGAYTVNINGKDITFLDTPGHEAFTAMRARGAMATDIAILVVAADDGIMPQTIEAINHAKAAGVDIIVAINKMDKPGANPDAIKQELTAYDLIPEEWGGDVICVPVSALTGMGIESLLENILLVAELKALSANPKRRAKGLVIESRLDKGRGPVATVLVQNGTLKVGDTVIAGTAVGRIRAMSDDKGRNVKSAGPSMPVEIIGLSEVPESGEQFAAVEDEKMARELVEQRKAKQKDEMFKASAKVSLNDLFDQISSGVKELKIIVKADVGGSAEAVKSSLVKLSTEEVKVSVIHSAVGGITEGDVMLASASNAIIVGFNVRPDRTAIECAERQNVDIRTYRVIYDCTDEIEAALKGMLAPKYEERLLGHAEVRQTIRVPSVGTIAGSYVLDGKIARNALIRVVRDGVVVYEDKISSLKRFKDDAKEVAQGYECGVGLEKFNDIKIGDVLEAYEMAEIER